MFTAVAPVLFPMVMVLAFALLPMFTPPVVPESKVNAPLVPVVIEKALVAPVVTLDAPKPDKVKVPEVAVKLSAPVVIVKPLLAVSKPAEVIVPVLVVPISPVVEMVILVARSLPLTAAKTGKPDAFPCSTVVPVPANVPNNPLLVFVTTPAVLRPLSVIDDVPVKAVNVPAAAVPPPIAPGAEKVNPLSDEAFRFATFVVDDTTNGAVPVLIVEVI
jgi:hypothetical protein